MCICMPSRRVCEKVLDKLSVSSSTTSLDVGITLHVTGCRQSPHMFAGRLSAAQRTRGQNHLRWKAEDYLDFTRVHHWPNGVVKMGAGGAMMRNNALFCGPFRQRRHDRYHARDALTPDLSTACWMERRRECLRRGCVVGVYRRARLERSGRYPRATN